MGADPAIKLSSLRDIGWREWDPIGLLPPDRHWDEEPFADEYDRYLLKAAGDLRRGGALEDAVRYLLEVEREHMGLGPGPGQEARAEATARSIQRYITELDRQNPTSA
ncbi:hypothetical protein [Enterovirga aerilata]|uniref:Uncharacterized protein n=1 Tax=Enterovirga aerilata TaxID=2730920 RepID=A0A849I931_9HYPH|nr:hypothetical protein [Enterovirga sp. DB1703]NNM72507.1 hypothetical protein [Enterovirga sp. DB1703]